MPNGPKIAGMRRLERPHYAPEKQIVGMKVVYGRLTSCLAAEGTPCASALS